MKDNGKLILGILVVVILFFYGGELFSVFQPSTQNFIQYTGTPICSGSTCSFFTGSQLASKTVEINTGKNTFRFESEVEDIVEKKICHSLVEKKCSMSNLWGCTSTFIDSDECQHWDCGSNSINNWGWYRDPCGQPSSGADCFVSGNAQIGCSTGDKYGGQYCGVCMGGSTSKIDFGGSYISTTNSEGLINRQCYQKIKVYKNNQLIDTLYSESTMGENSGIYYDEVSGSGVRVDMQNSWFETSVCSAYQNSYELMFDNDAFTINISSPKEEYLQGEPIELEVSVLNDLNIQLNGELLIDYEVPTILGTKTKTESQDVIINQGNNIFTYSIPTDEPLSILKVKPKLIINYPTTGISGVNYNFGDGTVVNIKSQSDFVVGSIEEDWSEIQVTSLAQYYQEQLNLTESELSLLNASLQEKLDLIEQYKGNLEYQSNLVDELSASLDEKILLVKSLQLNLDDQNELISNLELNLDEKIILVNQLNLNIAEQAQTIQSLSDISAEQAQMIIGLDLRVSDQANIINEMGLTLSNQADLISNLELSVSEQSTLINNLNLNIQQQQDLINQLDLTVTEKQYLISQLELTLSDQAQQIIDLNLNIQQQADYINNLNINLQEKAYLISQLTATNEEQARLLSLMELSFSDQADIIIALQNTVSDDAEIINNLHLTINNQVILINEMQLSVSEQAELIVELNLNLADQQELVNKLESTIIDKILIILGLQENLADQIAIITGLELTISEMANQIIDLNLNLADQAEYISQLDLSNVQKANLINELNLNLADQTELIINLNQIVSDDAEIIKNLNLSLTQEAELIGLYTNELEIQAELIANLELSLEEEQVIVNQLRDTIEEQLALLELIQSKKQFNIQDFWEEYKIAILIIGGLLFLMFIIGGRKK